MITKRRLNDVKRKLDIKEIAEGYGLELTGGPERYFSLCMFHHGDTVPSLVFYQDNSDDVDSFSAFCCNLAGDVIQFIIEFETRVNDNPTTFYDALKIAEKFVGIIIEGDESVEVNDYLKEKAREAKEGTDRSVAGYKFLLNVFYRDALKDHKDKKAYRRIKRFCDNQYIIFDHFFNEDPTIEVTEVFKREKVAVLKQYIKEATQTKTSIT